LLNVYDEPRPGASPDVGSGTWFGSDLFDLRMTIQRHAKKKSAAAPVNMGMKYILTMASSDDQPG